MASILNIPNCGQQGTGNTGIDVCKTIRKSFGGSILADPSFKLTPANMADVDTCIAALEAAALAARGSRIYPIYEVSNAEPRNTEATRASIGNINTGTVKTNDAIPGFDLQHYNGENYHLKLGRLEGQTLDSFLWDKDFTLYGYYDSDGNLHPYELSEFYTDIPLFGTGSETAKYPFGMTLKSAQQYKNQVGYVKLDSRLAAIVGLLDVNLSVFNHTTNVVKIGATIEGAGSNFIELFNGELDASAAWSVTNQATGAAFTVTSYAYDSTNKVITITLDSTAYTALSSGAKIDINLVGAAALDALNVSPYESTGKVTITKA